MILPMRVGLILLLLLATSSGDSRAQDSAAPNKLGASSVEVSLVPDKTDVMLGEPTHLSFIVKNKTDRNLQIIVGGDYRNALGRPETFTMTVVGADGIKVPQPATGMSMGGIVGPQKLPASGAYTFRLFLPHWATFAKPGNYTVTAKRILQLKEVSKDNHEFLKETNDVPSEASVQIQIVPLDPVKMGELIESLGKQMLAQVGHSENRETTMALKAIQDERVIPYFRAALGTNDYEMKFHALDALATFNSDLALDGLKEGMKTAGTNVGNTTTPALANQLADNIRHSAGVALSRSPHPDALKFLVEQQNDPYYGVRLDVAHALGSKMNPAEAIPILEKMADDPNEMVSGQAKRYLQLLRPAK